LIEMPILLTDAHAEIADRADDEQREQAAEHARTATRCHQLLCTPSITVCTIF
jgi:hypothetical protein